MRLSVGRVIDLSMETRGGGVPADSEVNIYYTFRTVQLLIFASPLAKGNLKIFPAQKLGGKSPRRRTMTEEMMDKEIEEMEKRGMELRARTCVPADDYSGRDDRSWDKLGRKTRDDLGNGGTKFLRAPVCP